MIFIISTDSDQATSDVIEWLNNFKKKYSRINNFFGVSNVQLSLSENIMAENKLPFFSDSQDSVWYRRLPTFNSINKADVKGFYEKESLSLANYIFSSEENYKKILGASFQIVNKLKILNMAKKHGLTIPETLITNSHKTLLAFHKKHKQIITKPISEVFISQRKNNLMVTYTKIVKLQDINSLPENFSLTLFQKFIDKEFDIRIFYLNEKLYAMAIFSQKSKKTEVDFRNYNYANPNRTI